MDSADSQKTSSPKEKAKTGRVWPDWYPRLIAFKNSDNRKAAWQLANTLVPYGCLWYLMIVSMPQAKPSLETFALVVVAAAFLVRIFILFHDCVHGSLFASKKANKFFGYVLGVLVFTSFEDWRFSHLRHHASYANLDTRGFGDIWTMTLKEYQASPKRIQWQYRLYRNPVVLIGLGALFNFLLSNRLPTRNVQRKEHMSILLTNLLIISVVISAVYSIGWQTYLLIQLPVLWLAGAAGIWLFYVQHQFEGGYWARTNDWDPLLAAMKGSSFYKLPEILRWFSGNIGYHHIHHLSPGIPNYHLKTCCEAVPVLREKEPLTLRQSFSCVHLKMWDEEQHHMIAFPRSG